LSEKGTCRKDIRELRGMIAMLKASHKEMLRKDLEPLQKRMAKLKARASRKRR
jgi:hypothetical protein